MSQPPSATLPAPLVSVLITVYNREQHLRACLASVLAQTWRDFEVIIVDDASTDGSLALARALAREAGDARVQVHANERNLGDYPNRHRAIELARGRYLKFVDSDDLIYPHSLAIMLAAMQAHPDAVMGLCQSAPELEQPYPWKLAPEAAWRRQFLGRGCLDCGPTGAIFSREAYFAAGGFGHWGVLSDTDFWYRLSARRPVVLLPPGLVWWRRHEQQEFRRDNAAMVYLERGFALTVAALNSPECPLSAVDRHAALRRARQHHARRLLALGLRARQPAVAWRLWRASGLGAAGLLQGLRPYLVL